MRRSIVALFLLVVVGAGPAAWHWRSNALHLGQSVRQAIQPPPTVHFAVVGDNHGVNPIYQQIISQIKSQDYQFLLNLADTSEFGTTEEFQAVKQLESQLPFPVYHTVGNHDIKTDDTRQSFLNVFGQARWYSLDHDQLHLIILDNADRKIGFPPEELDWLQKDLAAHSTNVNIIAYHRPFDLPLAAVLGDDETKVSTASNERFKTILSEAHVSYILTAHLHTYLSYDVAGIPAVVSGGGGDPAQTILGGPKNNYFHYLDVTVKDRDVNITIVPVHLTTPTPE